MKKLKFTSGCIGCQKCAEIKNKFAEQGICYLGDNGITCDCKDENCEELIKICPVGAIEYND